MEKFHKAYIVESLETMGVDRASAKNMASEIEKHKGMTEHEIKVKIFQKLNTVNMDLANKYMSTKKVHVKSEAMQVKGNVLLPEFIMTYIKIRNGDKIDVIHGYNNSVLRAYELKDIYHHQDHDIIFMSEKDMNQMEIKEKNQVAICKHHEQ